MQRSLRLAGHVLVAAMVLAGGGFKVARDVAHDDFGGHLAGRSEAANMPLTAGGCNDNVCIELEGSGTHVSDWNTTAWAGGSICTHPNFLVNGVLEAQGNTQCVKNAWVTADWDNLTFPAGTVLCNTWANISGEPCETIES